MSPCHCQDEKGLKNTLCSHSISMLCFQFFVLFLPRDYYHENKNHVGAISTLKIIYFEFSAIFHALNSSGKSVYDGQGEKFYFTTWFYLCYTLTLTKCWIINPVVSLVVSEPSTLHWNDHWFSYALV